MAIIFSDLPPQYRNQIIEQYKKQGKQIPPEIMQALQEKSLEQKERRLLPQNPAKRNKYHNQPTKRLGAEKAISFQSSKEARRFDELLQMVKLGLIRKLKIQPQFTLQESFITPEGKRVQAIKYIADFSYERLKKSNKGETWEFIVEDVKVLATRTPNYNTKRKMMLEKYGIDIVEVW